MRAGVVSPWSGTRNEKDTMTASEATVITGIDDDGKREGKRLAQRFPNAARYVLPSQFASTITSKGPLFAVMVSHIENGWSAQQAIVEGLKPLSGQLPILVLAMCSSAGTESPVTGESLASHLATLLRTEVRATTRFLTFDEVGCGYAFAQSGLASFILPNNYKDGLWKTVSPAVQNSVSELTITLDGLKI